MKTESEIKIRYNKIQGILIIIIGLSILCVGGYYLFTTDNIISQLHHNEPITFFVFLLTGFFLILIISLIGIYYTEEKGNETKKEIIDSEITMIEPIIEGNSISFLNTTFRNGKSFLIKIDGNIDLTVNSKLILTLKKKYRYEKEYYKGWEIDNIIKMPK